MAPKSIHAILPAAAIVVGLPLLAGGVWYVVTVTAPYEAPAGKTVFDLAQGKWHYDTSDRCKAYNTISFSPDHKTMLLTDVDPDRDTVEGTDTAWTYDILKYDQNSIRGAIRGETRRTPKGSLVVWDLILRSPDTFVWHRTDWLPRAYTVPVHRCADSSLKRP